MKKISYYQRVELTQNIIKKLISSGSCTTEDIKRHISDEMQMGSRFVEKYIEERIASGYAIIGDANIISETKK